MATTQLRRIEASSQGLRIQIIAAGVFLLAVCRLVPRLCWFAFGLDPELGRLVLWCMWISLPLLWAAGSWLAWAKWQKGGYFMTEDALIIRKSTLTGTVDDMYRFDSMISVQVRQGPLGKQSGYGTITISVPKLSKDLVLQHVSNPQNLALELKASVSRKSTGGGSLVH